MLAALMLASCAGLEKSENVLSPTVAGPIPGVSIEQPRPLDPKDGRNIEVASQPLTLLLENSPNNSQRPISYLFEIATDSAFNTKVFTRAGVASGEGGRTSLRLPEALATGRTYYWRAQAGDGANTGPYSGPAHFNIFTPIVIGKPVPQQPINNVMLGGLVPTFVVANPARSGPVGPVTYTIEVADGDSFANKFAVWTVAEQLNQTRLEAPSGLPSNRQYFWRVQAGDSAVAGPWSDTQVFRTPVIQAPTPTPGPLPITCTLPQPTPFQTLQCARNGYPRPMSGANRGALMNQVAWLHRADSWGLHLKTSGNRCPQPTTGKEISCDILVHGNTGTVYDVLIDEEEPTWGVKGPINSMSNFVAPVQP